MAWSPSATNSQTADAASNDAGYDNPAATAYPIRFADTRLCGDLRDAHATFGGRLYYGLFTDYAAGRPSRDSFATEDALPHAIDDRMGPGVVVSEDRSNRWPREPGPAVLPDVVTSTADFEAGLRALTAREVTYAAFVPNIVHVRIEGNQNRGGPTGGEVLRQGRGALLSCACRTPQAGPGPHEGANRECISGHDSR